MRQRNYELEVQNGHLHRHIMLLQDQQLVINKDSLQLPYPSLTSFTQQQHNLFRAQLADQEQQQQQLQAQLQQQELQERVAAVGSLLAAAVLDKKVPKVPHTGADIW